MGNWNDNQQPDTQPGPYYVTARKGDRYALMRGPYDNHADALAAVRETMLKACDLDPQAHWLEWGTARRPIDLGRRDPGRMNQYFNKQD